MLHGCVNKYRMVTLGLMSMFIESVEVFVILPRSKSGSCLKLVICTVTVCGKVGTPPLRVMVTLDVDERPVRIGVPVPAAFPNTTMFFAFVSSLVLTQAVAR